MSDSIQICGLSGKGVANKCLWPSLFQRQARVQIPSTTKNVCHYSATQKGFYQIIRVFILFQQRYLVQECRCPLEKWVGFRYFPIGMASWPRDPLTPRISPLMIVHTSTYEDGKFLSSSPPFDILCAGKKGLRFTVNDLGTALTLSSNELTNQSSCIWHMPWVAIQLTTAMHPYHSTNKIWLVQSTSCQMLSVLVAEDVPPFPKSLFKKS